MKVLKNYKKTGEVLDGDFPFIKLTESEDVFAELPLCVVEYNTFYKEPVLFAQPNKMPMVVEKTALLEKLSKLKKFYFLVNEETGQVQEVEKEKANLAYRLPKDTPVDKLVYQNGEILLIENEEVSK
jgi:hypothetical protein